MLNRILLLLFLLSVISCRNLESYVDDIDEVDDIADIDDGKGDVMRDVDDQHEDVGITNEHNEKYIKDVRNESTEAGTEENDSYSRDHSHGGDIIFKDCEREAKFVTKSVSKKCKKQDDDIYAIEELDKKWPLPIPYQIEDSLGSEARSVISQAIQEYALKTCITFRPKVAGDTNYLSYYDGVHCSSIVGRIGGKQPISLASHCHHKGTAIHETMHALGFYHEQSRHDRDRFVNIYLENLADERSTPNFDILQESEFNTFGQQYDYDSVMHYARTALGARNFWGVRMVTIASKEDYDRKLGQCDSCGMSIIDANKLNLMYCSVKSNTVNLDTLTLQLQRYLAAHNGENHYKFSQALLLFLTEIYPKHYFVVAVYNPVSGYLTHASNGQCTYIWRTYGRNVLICPTRKNSNFPSFTKQTEIMKGVRRTIRDRGCNAKWARGTALNKARSYGFPIAMVHVVRDGSGIHAAASGFTRYMEFRCQRSCRKDIFGTHCTNEYSSFGITFGSR